MRNINIKIKAVLGTAVMAVVLAGLMTLAPFAIAETVTGSGDSALNVNVRESIAVGLDASGIAFSITPTSAGAFSSGSMNVHVYTNAKGYKLYLSSKTDDTSLKHIDSNISQSLNTLTTYKTDLNVTAGIIESAFPVNSWGYSLDGVNYFGVKSASTPTVIRETKNWTSIGDSITELHFGAKANMEMPAGTYQNTLVVMAEATVIPPRAPSLPNEIGWVRSATITPDSETENFAVKTYEFMVSQDENYTPLYEENAMASGREFTLSRENGYADGIYYVFARAVDVNGSKSEWSERVKIKLDTTAPTTLFATTDTLTAKKQTATLRCEDSKQLSAYYFGTNENPTDDDFAEIPAETGTGLQPTTWETTRDITAAGTYYLICKDSTDGVSDVANKTYYTYKTVTLLDTLAGTAGNYIQANYEASTTGETYIAPAGVTIQPRDFYTVPTPYTNAERYRGSSIVYDATTPAQLSTADQNLTRNTTFYAWFDRFTYTLKLNRVTGISNVEGEGTYKHGATANIKATVQDGYSWKKWEVVSGNAPANANVAETTVFMTQDTELTATNSDGTKPTVTKTERKAGTNDTIQFTITDNVAVAKYCVTTANTQPGADDACWANANNAASYSNETQINGAGTWKVWGMDTSGNISNAAGTIAAYTVERSASNATLTTAWENASGTTFSADTFALAGTPIYVSATPMGGFESATITWYDGAASTELSSGSTRNVTTNTRIVAGATDTEGPAATIVSATSNAGATSQTVSLKCEDTGTKVKYWYFGTDQNPADSAFTTLATATQTWTKTDASVSAAGTYYLICKDASGNVSNKPSQAFYTYQVKTVLNTVAGTETTYNSSNYAETGDNSTVYLAKAGQSVQPGDYKQVPTGSVAGNYKGYSTTFNGTAVIPATANATVNANTTFYAWYWRNKYTVTLNSGTGISSTTGSGTYKYGATAGIDATVSAGYAWTAWKNGANNYSTTKDTTISNITADWTLTATAADNEGPKVTAIGRSSYNTITFTLEDQGSGIASYCANSTGTAPTAAQCNTTTGISGTQTSFSGSIQMPSASAATWYIFGVDKSGNVTTAANSKTIASYKVDRSQGSGSTLYTCYDATTACATSNFTGTIYALQGTNIYMRATGNTNLSGYTGYTVTGLTWTPASSTAESVTVSGGYKTINGKNVTIASAAADNTAPSVTSISRTTGVGEYNKISFSIKDGVGVTGYCVTTATSTPALTDGCWKSVSSTTEYSGKSDAITATGTYYVYGRDAAGKTGKSSSGIAVYQVTRTITPSGSVTLNTYVNIDSNSSSYAVTSSPFYVTSGTPIYISATPASGFTVESLKFGTENITSGTAKTVTTNVTITATGASAAMSSSSTYMQRVSKDMCTNTASGTAAVLADERVETDGGSTIDGQKHKKYLVGKLADGHCWMLQNLAVGNNSGTYALNTTYSNKTYTIPKGATSGFSSNTAQNFYLGSHTDPSTTATTVSAAPTMDSTSNTGGYYTWCTATTGVCGSYTSDGADVNSGKTQDYNDICPRGWRLPTKAEITTLYNSASTYGPLFKIGLVGYYYNSSLNGSGSFAYWWSSTANSSTYAYRLGTSSASSFGSVRSNYRYSGFSVRCVL